MSPMAILFTTIIKIIIILLTTSVALQRYPPPAILSSQTVTVTASVEPYTMHVKCRKCKKKRGASRH